jgi:uncharacterized protein YwqG
MIIAKILKIKNIRPIECEIQKDLIPGQEYIRIGPYNGEIKNEKGKATFEVLILQDDELQNIDEILLTGEFPYSVKLLDFKKLSPKNYEFDLYFDQIFQSGFDLTIRSIWAKGDILLGFATNEKESFYNVENQKILLENLIDTMISTKKEKIRSLILPCYSLKFIDKNSVNKSHFVGNSQIAKGTEAPLNSFNKPLFHIATLKKEDIKQMFSRYSNAKIAENLSFHVDINEFEEDAPTFFSRFKISNYEEEIEIQSPSLYFEIAKEMVFEERLDLPCSDHCIIQNLKLSQSGLDNYDKLRSTFNMIISKGEEELNKFLGYPNTIQGCVAHEAEIITTKKGYSDVSVKSAAQWQLLLQISPYAHWFKFFDAFGDASIYFMIKKEDLQLGNFENVIMITQCT